MDSRRTSSSSGHGEDTELGHGEDTELGHGEDTELGHEAPLTLLDTVLISFQE